MLERSAQAQPGHALCCHSIGSLRRSLPAAVLLRSGRPTWKKTKWLGVMAKSCGAKQASFSSTLVSSKRFQWLSYSAMVMSSTEPARVRRLHGSHCFQVHGDSGLSAFWEP